MNDKVLYLCDLIKPCEQLPRSLVGPALVSVMVLPLLNRPARHRM